MPRPLNSRCKELVASLLNYFEHERDNNGPLIPLTSVRQRVADALNLSINTVSKISQTVVNQEALNSPKKKRCYLKRVTNTDRLDTSAIRNAVYEMCEKKLHVTLSSLLELLKKRQLFDGCTMSLRTVLKDIGFRWKKDDPRRGLMELLHIALKRLEFLRSYMKEKDEKLYQFVFLDETWIFQNGTVGRSWQDENKRSVKTLKVDGKRFIVLHAGTENGFVNGAEAIFASKTQLSDYHGEMNQENFLKWFENQLLKNLQQPSAIVMDNAPYHSTLLEKTPNSSWTKPAIQEWLRTRNIQFPNMMFKKELLDIVSRNKPPRKYLVDELAEQYGHKVLRLPPYHCIFNPIELVWGAAKNYYNKNIGRDGKTEKDALNMWKEALASVTPHMWGNCVKHTEGEILKWYEREHVFEREEILPIVISVNVDDSSDDFSEMESD